MSFAGVQVYLAGTTDFPARLKGLSTFFEIDDGVAHAVQAFERKGPDFDAALQFELARYYRVDHWIKPAFERLMELPMTGLDMVLMDRLGQAGYFWLIKTKTDIEKHRKQFTFDAPSIQNDPDCQMPAYCGAAWYREWSMKVPKLVHHPEIHISLVKVLKQLGNTEITGLCDACQKRTVTWIWGTGHVTVEQDYIDTAVAALMALQTDEPIRAAMRKEVVRSPTPVSSTTSISHPPSATIS
ncbi:hypothetical protein MVEN_01119000 [Mycena venus]|uniref:Uncharacterized protein n=1 Tax=Mycena venus TaxID=2733690 RepID=A0A8H6Y9H1_9AGAR|nr:hypothetical protein MVEN_01119000 [Mycena venus]